MLVGVTKLLLLIQHTSEGGLIILLSQFNSLLAIFIGGNQMYQIIIPIVMILLHWVHGYCLVGLLCVDVLV